jgi:hypothetical protein
MRVGSSDRVVGGVGEGHVEPSRGWRRLYYNITSRICVDR